MDNLEKYYKLKKEIDEISYIANVLYYDATTDSPTKAREYSYDIQAKLASKAINLQKSKKYKDVVKALINEDNLSSELKRAMALEMEEIEKLEAIPNNIMKRHLNNQNRAYLAWEKGRETLDYKDFERELKELVKYYRYYISKLEKDNMQGYDVLLNDFEHGFGTKEYDRLFDLIEKELVPLIQKILAKKDSMPDLGPFPISKQRELSSYLRKLLNYNDDRGCLRETIHPYTIPIYIDDARITTAYDEANVFSNMYSVMHETGHALYALGLNKDFIHTSLYQSCSMSMDESQSRFVENYIGRDVSFINFIKPYLESLFPFFKNFSLLELYHIINTVSAGLIRTEADELTYPIHVLIRYKIEKGLFNEGLEVKDINKTWNKLMEEYLGVKPKNKKEGCYQDVHWTSDFGYFPTYVLGSAISAQLLNQMKKEMDYDTMLEEGNLKPILDWLDTHIHQYGALYDTNDLLIKATGEGFNPQYYIDYLKEKFTKIYGVK